MHVTALVFFAVTNCVASPGVSYLPIIFAVVKGGPARAPVLPAGWETQRSTVCETQRSTVCEWQFLFAAQRVTDWRMPGCYQASMELNNKLREVDEQMSASAAYVSRVSIQVISRSCSVSALSCFVLAPSVCIC